MISRSKKQVNEVESDSDWDSLPGDVPEPGSSPEPMKSVSPQVPTHSPVPAPPKQPYSKHNASSKPANMYKNASNPVKKAGSATTFEDRTGGIWNDDDDHHGDIKVSFSKEKNNNVKNNNNTPKEKDTNRMRNVQAAEENKKPPFTDFREALSTPMPATSNTSERHEMAGVNQAYRIETGDEIHTNHDTWDDSENESQMQQSDEHQHNDRRPLGRSHHRTVTGTRTKQELSMDTSYETEHKLVRIKKNDERNGMFNGNHHFSTNQTFDNCCLIQVAEGAFDDRYRPSFFHGSKNHFHVKQDDPRATITDIADKSEVILQRFWREVFGVLQILINFFIIFILELFKTIIRSIRYLLTGILYTTGDHFVKPLLAAIFNNIVQPFSILMLNIFTIVTNLMRPVLALTREILSQVAIPLQAFRLFVFNWEYRGRKENSCTDVKVV